MNEKYETRKPIQRVNNFAILFFVNFQRLQTRFKVNISGTVGQIFGEIHNGWWIQRRIKTPKAINEGIGHGVKIGGRIFQGWPVNVLKDTLEPRSGGNPRVRAQIETILDANQVANDTPKVNECLEVFARDLNAENVRLYRDETHESELRESHVFLRDEAGIFSLCRFAVGDVAFSNCFEGLPGSVKFKRILVSSGFWFFFYNLKEKKQNFIEFHNYWEMDRLKDII